MVSQCILNGRLLYSLPLLLPVFAQPVDFVLNLIYTIEEVVTFPALYYLSFYARSWYDGKYDHIKHLYLKPIKTHNYLKLAV